MQKVLLLLALACTHILTSHAQYCIDGRFTENDYFSDGQILTETDISYGLASHWYMDIPQPSLNSFDISYPDPAIDPLEKRPLIVLAHGGGFWGGDKSELSYYLQRLAKSGYVAVSINYRKGWDGNPEDCTGDALSLSQAIYKSIQDSKASLRYLVEHADTYGIDTGAIFIGGESAGSYAMMNSVYVSQAEWDLVHPGFELEFGDFDHSTNLIAVNYTVKGFINISGGVLDTAFASQNELKPTISFYGTADDIVPPYDGNIQYCENFEHVNGSAGLAEHLDNYNICNALNQHFMYGHEAYEPDYIIGNMACFIKSIFCNECVTTVVNYQEADCTDMVLTVDDAVKDQIKVFPNPADQFAVTQLSTPISDHFTIKISDVSGKSMAVNYTISQNMVTLDVAGLATGMYAVMIDNNGILSNTKIMISR